MLSLLKSRIVESIGAADRNIRIIQSVEFSNSTEDLRKVIFNCSQGKDRTLLDWLPAISRVEQSFQ